MTADTPRAATVAALACDCPYASAQPHKRDGCRYAVTDNSSTRNACGKCDRQLNRKTVVHTRVGPRCKRCADRMPPWTRR